MDKMGVDFDEYVEERLKENPEFRGYFEEARERIENEFRLVEFARARLRELGIKYEEALLARVTVNWDVVGSKPTVRGTSIAVEQIVEALAGGASEDDLLTEYPDLEREDLTSVLAYVTRYGLGLP